MPSVCILNQFSQKIAKKAKRPNSEKLTSMHINEFSINALPRKVESEGPKLIDYDKLRFYMIASLQFMIYLAVGYTKKNNCYIIGYLRN